MPPPPGPPDPALLRRRRSPMMKEAMKPSLPAGALLALLAACGGACREAGPPLVIGCAGDSLMRPIPGHLRRLLPSSSIPRFVLHEWARGGLSVAGFRNVLGREAERWKTARADVVLVQLGTNDVAPLLTGRTRLGDFKADLTAVIRRFRTFRTAKGERPRIILGTVPSFADDPSNIERNRFVRAALNPAVREVAEREGVCLADCFGVLEGRPDLYDPDGVHPSAAGELALAENWVRAVKGCRPT